MAESELKFGPNEMRASIAFHWKKVLSPGECHKEIISILGNGAVSLAITGSTNFDVAEGHMKITLGLVA